MDATHNVLCHGCLKTFPDNEMDYYEIMMQNSRTSDYFGDQIYSLCHQCRDNIQIMINKRDIRKGLNA
jgi:hypothetical protein